MKLYEHPKTEEKIDRLPEMPEGVVVPEDISGLHLPTALKPTAGGYRWMRWLAAIIVLGATGVLAAVLFTGGDNAIETAQVEMLDSGQDLAASDYMGTFRVNYMELYGTDNPVFVQATTAGRVATDYMELYGTDNPAFAAATDYAVLYGTDNPVFVQATDEFLGTFGTVDTGQYLELYGTDNPVFVWATTAGRIATDNAVFVPDTDYMARYGTDNPVFVQATDEFVGTFGTVDTGQYLELYGTDNPVFVQASP